MASSSAPTVAAYLAELPPDRRATVARVRDLVNATLPRGYEEMMLWGMIAWVIPLSRYPVTYNKQPLTVVALASQKGNVALYLTAPYMVPGEDEALRAAWKAAGKKLDMGKSCLRFKAWEDLVPDAVARALRALTPEAYITVYERSRGITGGAATGTTSTATTRARTSATPRTAKTAGGTARAKTAAKSAAKTTATSPRTTRSAASSSRRSTTTSRTRRG